MAISSDRSLKLLDHQNQLSFPEDALDTHDVCVLVVCRETFMREAIEHSLRDAGLPSVQGVSNISELGECRYNRHAFLCIIPSEADGPSEEELRHIEDLGDRNWIVMSHSPNCVLFNKLNEIGANVSAVPFEISGDDLAHLARLAANHHRVLVDEFCDAIISVENARSALAHLTPEQTKLLKQIADGDPNKLIAKRDGCAETKVKMQVRALFKKLGVANRTQAAVLAIRAGL